MKKDFRKNNGAIVITVIFGIIIACVVGGAAFLGIRMVVTGEEFLAPLEEWGWIKAEEKDEKKSSNTAISEEAEDDDVTHYQMDYGEIFKLSFAKSFSGSGTTIGERYSSMSSKEKAYQKVIDNFLDEDFDDIVVIDLYAKKNELVELDLLFDLDALLEPLYKEMNKNKDIKDELEDYDIYDYDDFKEYFAKYFILGFNRGLGQENQNFEDLVDEDAILDFLMDDMNIGELGFSRRDLKKCLSVDVDEGKILITFEFSDDMNEMILDYIDENIDELEEEIEELSDSADEEIPDFIKDFKLSKKTYVKDLVELYNETLEWMADNEDMFDFSDDEELMDAIVDSMKIKTVK